MVIGWNIQHQLLLSSQANGKWCQYIPEHCHSMTMYEACSVSNVPTAKIFVEQASYFVVGGTDSKEITCNRWCNSQSIMLFKG